MGASVGEELARRICSQLQSRGFAAFLVGGCVRDMLLGREPTDFDVATSARPDQVLGLFERSGLVGAHFGVVLVNERGITVEVATFRSDHSYRDGRRPEAVSFETDPRQDALRRDFTVNALMLDPATGEVHDFVGGRKDLDAKLIRAIGDPVARFGEDHLRTLRAIRFAARLQFTIDSATMTAIRDMRKLIHRVSAERVHDELTRILTEGGARRGFELLDESGLLDELLPEISAMKGVEQPPQYHPEGDVWVHTKLMLEALRDPSPSLAWGALLHDVGKPPTFQRGPGRIRFNGHVEQGVEMSRAILGRLRASGEEIERVTALVENHMRPKDVHRMRTSTLKRFLRMEHFDEHLELHRLDCLSSNRNLSNYDFLRRKLEELPPEELRPQRLVTGEDLIALGLEPGPRFREILDAVEDAQLEKKLSTREEALDWLKRNVLSDP